MRLSITFDERQLVRFLGRGQRTWPEAASRALQKIGRAVFDESQREVPVGATARLRTQTFFGTSPHEVRIVYLASYARIVHFRRHVRHPQGKSFFLSTPMTRGKRVLGAEIQVEVQREMDKTPST